jgi:hypothetical protein
MKIAVCVKHVPAGRLRRHVRDGRERCDGDSGDDDETGNGDAHGFSPVAG